MKDRITEEIAFALLSKNLEEGQVLFSYDDGWNAKEWHRGIPEGDKIKTLENYTWEGYSQARTRWGSFSYKPEEIKLVETN